MFQLFILIHILDDIIHRVARKLEQLKYIQQKLIVNRRESCKSIIISEIRKVSVSGSK